MSFGQIFSSDNSLDQAIENKELSYMVVLDGHDDFYQSVNQSQLPDSLSVNTITYEVDGTYKKADLNSLLQLSSKDQVSKQDVINALFYIKQLGIFEEIILECRKVDNISYDLIFKLKQAMLIDYVKVQGFLRNKQKIKNLYMVDEGEVFDQQKHLYSLENIKNYFKNLGYLQTKIYDSVLTIKDANKVVVSCDVALARRFLINQVITSVHYVGDLDFVDQSHLKMEITDYLTHRLADRKYSIDLINSVKRKLKNFLESQGFVDIDLNIKYEFLEGSYKVDVYINVTLEKKREFVFWGNSFFRSDQILSHLLLYGKSAWYFPLSIIEDEIETLYKNKGFKDIKVRVKEDKQRVFCSISEGPRATISSVSILGALKNHKAADMLHVAFKPCLKAYYQDQDLLKRCLDNFIKDYKAAGFWDVKILRQEFLPALKKYDYEFVITVDEGPIKKLRNYLFAGSFDARHVSVEKDFLKCWQQKKGLGFDQTLLSEQKLWLLKYCKSRGVQKVLISYEILETEEQDFFDVRFNIDVVKKNVRFGQTVIIGNTTAAHSKLLLECNFKPGDLWDKRKLDQTLKNFKEIKVFENVQIYPGPELDPFGYRPVFIKLQNAERYDIKATFGLQQIGRNLQLKRGFTYKVGTKVGVNRLFSSVDRFSLYADVTRFYQNAGLTYDIPWLKKQRIRTQIKGFNEYYQRPVYVGSHNFLYKATKQGFLCNMVRAYQDSSVSASLGFEFLGLYEQDQPDLNRIILYDRNLLAQKIAYIFCEPIAIWRVVDNELNPQNGHQSVISCKAMFDCSNKTTFYKVSAEHTQYIALTDWAVLALKARAGHVFNRNFSQLHPNERFYLGGACSVRGYMPDYCPPFGALTIPIKDEHTSLPPCANDIWRYAPQGGRTMFNINAEMRLNLYKGLGMVLFSDWGALIQDSISQELQGQDRRNFGGSGVGFRYDTPLGPFRFDVGVKWHIEKPDFEARHVLYLSMGQAF